MGYIIYKGKKLEHIEHVTDFIDEEKKAKCDLFNSEGALLSVKGSIPREKIFHVAVYTYQDVYKEYQITKSAGNIKAVQPEEEQLNIKKEQLKKSLGQQTVHAYEQAIKAANTIIDGTPITDKKLAAANELVSETLNQDRLKLHSCISELRTIDSYTYDHSFSVSLLMAQALEDFRPYQDRDEYWKNFKTISGKVNFSKNGMQRYCVGALLHDFGKTMIPKPILHKSGTLTVEEFAVMRKHPFMGTEALHKAGVNDPQVMEIVGNHHASYLTYKERGQSALALICNIVDIYDACRSKRVYKESFGIEMTMDILRDEYNKWTWNPFIFNVIVNQTLPKFETQRKDKVN